jgi:PRTRC genetic system protein B
MKITDHIGSEGGEVKLQRAILLYGDKDRTVATIHPIAFKGLQPVIMAGHPASAIALQELVIQLTSRHTSDYLTENILCASFTRIVWWLESAVRPIWFAPDGKNDKAIKRLSGKSVTHPALVFMATSGGGLYVWALAANKRPGLTTKLLMAPYWNVSEKGSVCQGSGRRTKLLSPSCTKDYQSAFFDSNFTHTNIKGGAVLHPKGQLGFWSDLRSKRRKDIPIHWLRKTKLTLADVIDKKVFE